ncbi:MAG: rhomboid family intramembrane serine protease [Nitrospirae bacterium]|nr:rhomboid family intramembrane serine protease [Nitrospirota bacterium]
MIPLKDDNPTTITPVVTVGLIVINAAVFAYQLSLGAAGQAFVATFGATPLALFGGEPTSPIPPTVTLFTAMFLHGGIMHVGGNMLYLWIFGNNIEDVMGHGRFVVFYLLCGVAAAYAHALSAPASVVPMIGASGAISGVLGAYLLLFPRARVLTLIPLGFYTRLVYVPAAFVLGFWIVIQLFSGTLSLGGRGGGVAWFAHVGGFLAGMLLIRLFVRRWPQRHV